MMCAISSQVVMKKYTAKTNRPKKQLVHLGKEYMNVILSLKIFCKFEGIL